MNHDPTPFEEVPDARKGYRTFYFEYEGEPLQLMTYERETGPHSLISYRNGFRSRERGGIGLTSIPGTMTVEGVVTMLRICKQEREIGRREGTLTAQQKIRNAMGMA
jgi:hypothetical protein